MAAKETGQSDGTQCREEHVGMSAREIRERRGGKGSLHCTVQAASLSSFPKWLSPRTLSGLRMIAPRSLMARGGSPRRWEGRRGRGGTDLSC